MATHNLTSTATSVSHASAALNRVGHLTPGRVFNVNSGARGNQYVTRRSDGADLAGLFPLSVADARDLADVLIRSVG